MSFVIILALGIADLLCFYFVPGYLLLWGAVLVSLLVWAGACMLVPDADRNRR
jgi:hypothetical protein